MATRPVIARRTVESYNKGSSADKVGDKVGWRGAMRKIVDRYQISYFEIHIFSSHRSKHTPDRLRWCTTLQLQSTSYDGLESISSSSRYTPARTLRMHPMALKMSPLRVPPVRCPYDAADPRQPRAAATENFTKSPTLNFISCPDLLGRTNDTCHRP